MKHLLVILVALTLLGAGCQKKQPALADGYHAQNATTARQEEKDGEELGAWIDAIFISIITSITGN